MDTHFPRAESEARSRRMVKFQKLYTPKQVSVLIDHLENPDQVSLKICFMSELKKQQVECSFFESAFKTAVCATIFLDDYLAGVKNGKHKAAVERLRGYLAAHDAEHAESTKKRLLLLVRRRDGGGRKLEHMVRYAVRADRPGRGPGAAA